MVNPSISKTLSEESYPPSRQDIRKTPWHLMHHQLIPRRRVQRESHERRSPTRGLCVAMHMVGRIPQSTKATPSKFVVLASQRISKPDVIGSRAGCFTARVLRISEGCRCRVEGLRANLSADAGHNLQRPPNQAIEAKPLSAHITVALGRQRQHTLHESPCFGEIPDPVEVILCNEMIPGPVRVLQSRLEREGADDPATTADGEKPRGVALSFTLALPSALFFDAALTRVRTVFAAVGDPAPDAEGDELTRRVEWRAPGAPPPPRPVALFLMTRGTSLALV
ncbi:hypothetical protein R3P38DRAFT_3232186 [Favolaschia claudopus]|uniref:Uncharacterized protein n=1 Tax=Favolaschia claudopus TaxID=2862362 RepID=A0AAV9ZIL1_9AGAR